MENEPGDQDEMGRDLPLVVVKTSRVHMYDVSGHGVPIEASVLEMVSY